MTSVAGLWANRWCTQAKPMPRLAPMIKCWPVVKSGVVWGVGVCAMMISMRGNEPSIIMAACHDRIYTVSKR